MAWNSCPGIGRIECGLGKGMQERNKTYKNKSAANARILRVFSLLMNTKCLQCRREKRNQNHSSTLHNVAPLNT